MNFEKSNQMPISDILKAKETCKEHGCYLYAYIKNSVPYFTRFCSKDSCKNCPIDEDYVALRSSYINQGYSFTQAVMMAKDAIHKKHTLFTA